MPMKTGTKAGRSGTGRALQAEKIEHPLFTPNVQRGGQDGERYLLYRHAYRNGKATVSVTPDGPRFDVEFDQDDCGLGCRCAAFITSKSPYLDALLAMAKRYK